MIQTLQQAIAKVKVGVTGHRMNRLTKQAYQELAQPVAQVLKQLKQSEGSHYVVSALAEGADRLVAHEALAQGYRLQTILPFTREEYTKDFLTMASQQGFANLLEQSDSVIELSNSRQQTKPTAYEAVGHAIIENCTVLIAIWDGSPACGPGGTAEVVALAKAQNKPVIWIKPDAPYAVTVIEPTGF